ncbi:hypothetical protein LTR85_002884 [Meristemomyces frigidus]|nr:hypothetical protein LTR85_002884 [Meristemomyces frigidus]
MESSSTASLISTIDPPSLGPPNPVYAQITKVTLSETVTLLTIAGQVAVTPDGNTPETLGEQVDLCLSRLETCLAAADANVHDMTRFMYYLTEKAYEHDGALSLVVEKVTPWLEGHRPASCFLVVKSLSKAKFMCEFEAQAVVRTAIPG